MKVIVLSSCTKTKAHNGLPNQLTADDFCKGGEHLAKREAQLSRYMLPAEQLYGGQHHAELMKGVCAYRDILGSANCSVWILSAGYGLIPGGRTIAPYDHTFSGMKTADLEMWSDRLDIPAAVYALLAEERYDLALVLLGQTYLHACRLPSMFRGKSTASQVVAFVKPSLIRKLQVIDYIHPVAVSKPEVARFDAGSRMLKGKLGRLVLEGLAAGTLTIDDLVADGSQPLDALARVQRQFEQHA